MAEPAEQRRLLAQEPWTQRNRTIHGSSNLVTITLSIVQIVIGAKYLDPSLCSLDASWYLVVSGSIILSISVIGMIVTATKCKSDDRVMDIMSPVLSLLNFAVIIWGSIEIFGSYSTWSYTDPSNPSYCEYTPFMFAFVLLILFWLLLPIVFICQLVVLFTLLCCAGLKQDY